MPEGRELWPALTVLENLELGCYAKSARSHRHDSLARVFNLFPRLQERTRQMAGSMSGVLDTTVSLVHPAERSRLTAAPVA